MKKYKFRCGFCGKYFFMTREHIINMPDTISHWTCDNCGRAEIYHDAETSFPFIIEE